MKTLNKLLILLLLAAFIPQGCKKEGDFLNAKPNQSLSVPASLNDLQLLLKNEGIFNRNYPSLGQNSSDDTMLDASALQSDVPIDRNVFLWATPLYPAGANVNDWNYPYQQIYYANTILTLLPNIGGDSQSSAYKTVEGAALFFRAIAIYNLVQIFAVPYRKESATTDLAVPIPTSPNLDAKNPRVTMNRCYEFIISDLNRAADLLPATTSSPLNPSKAAVKGLLARVYLVMGDYVQALKLSVETLEIFSQLQDLNKLSGSARPVYASFSPEEIFHAGMLNYLSNGRTAQVNSDLFNLFNDPNDLRRTIYMRTASGLNYFNSQYDRRSNLTYSISTAELLLNKAECEARANNVKDAMADLNRLMVTRWKSGTYKTITATDQDGAMGIILTERRKELALTGMRWSDLKRLNQDPKYAVTLVRKVGGQTYTLLPNDPRYALSIPDPEILVNQIPQNNR